MSHERISCTLIGSLRKYSAEFNRIHDQFEDQNIEVKAPIKGTPVKEVNGYALFDLEDTTPPLTVETGYLSALLTSDFGYVINPNGYIGAHSTSEIALARLFNIPLYSLEPLDLGLDPSNHWQELGLQLRPLNLEKLPQYNRIRPHVDQLQLEHLALYVLAADWLKDSHGLGKILEHTQTNAHRLAGRLDYLPIKNFGTRFSDSKAQSISPLIGTHRSSEISSAGTNSNFS